MIRLRWFLCGGVEDAGGFYAKLLRRPFERENGCGFMRLNDPREPLAVRYIWTTEVFATRVNEAGEPQVETLVSESYVDFILKKIRGSTVLRVRNPSRSLSGLFNAIEKEAGFGFWVKGIELLPRASRLLSGDVRQVKLVGLKITNVIMGGDILARMEFLSKEGIQPAVLRETLELSHTVEFSSYDVLVGSHKGQIAFMRTGLVKVSQQLEQFVVEIVEADPLFLDTVV